EAERLGGDVELLDVVVRRAWHFTDLVPSAVLDTNAFGNLLVEDTSGRIWRICPEELSCEIVADSRADLEQLRRTADFVQNWEMPRLVKLAQSSLGTPGPGRCYCLKVPAVIGGAYAVDNLGTIALSELIDVSGDVAFQIKDLPDGTRVEVRIVD